MRIINATPDLIPQIVDIETSSFSSPWSEKSFGDAISSDKMTLCAAIDENGDLCGFICFLIVDSEAELLNIAVSNKFRKKGIGSLLLEHMLGVMRLSNVETVFLEVRESNTPARCLYQKYGFEIIGKRKKYYTLPTEDAILMQKNI